MDKDNSAGEILLFVIGLIVGVMVCAIVLSLNQMDYNSKIKEQHFNCFEQTKSVEQCKVIFNKQ